MKRGQSWSMDLVIAVVIFGFIAVIFYSLILIQQKPSVDQLQQIAQNINSKLEQPVSNCGPIIQNQVVTPEQLQCLYNKSYAEIQSELAVPSNFCIYVQDSQGRVYPVNVNGVTKYGVGDPELKLADVGCGDPVS